MKQPIQIFLCYARQDEEKISTLYEKLSSAGFQPFMDTKDILPGEDWKQVLMNTIREAPFFLACLSKNSVDKRGVIQEEIREALDVWRQKLDSDIYLIPVRLENCFVPGALAKFQWVDLFQDSGFERLMMALNIGMERLNIIEPVQLRSQPALNIGMERLNIIEPVQLRSQPVKYLSEDDVKRMLKKNDFYHADWHWMGKGIRHKYELLKGGESVFDKITGLTWQQSGSMKEGNFYSSGLYIESLNTKNFAAFDDWRLPTLEEAMSLVEPKVNEHDIYIDAVFDKVQAWIWTADGAWRPWYVLFSIGGCYHGPGRSKFYVRAVR